MRNHIFTSIIVVGFLLILPSAYAQTGAAKAPPKEAPKQTAGNAPAASQGSRAAYAPAFAKCKALVDAKKYADAQKACSEAVALSDKLPAANWRERSTPRILLGDSFLAAGNADDAQLSYLQALAIDEKQLKPDDGDLAADYANTGQAYFLLKNLDVSDMYFGKAEDSFEIAILNKPAMKEAYTRRLKDTLLKHAKLKHALGQENYAVALEQQANSLQ